MFILSLFLCLISIFILFLKYRLVLFGKLVDGEIIGYATGVPSTHGIFAYSYRVRYEYKGETYIANALQSKIKFGRDYPREHLGEKCQVYVNPKSPKLVTIKKFYALDIAIIFLFILGFLGMITSFII